MNFGQRMAAIRVKKGSAKKKNGKRMSFGERMAMLRAKKKGY